MELAATSLPHCVSTRTIGTTRASAAKGDPTIRNFETSKHWDHKPTPTLWRTLASFQIIGETMQLLRVPKIASPKATHTHTIATVSVVYLDRKRFSVNLSHYSEGGPATAFWMCLGNQKWNTCICSMFNINATLGLDKSKIIGPYKALNHPESLRAKSI